MIPVYKINKINFKNRIFDLKNLMSIVIRDYFTSLKTYF